MAGLDDDRVVSGSETRTVALDVVELVGYCDGVDSLFVV
jgi:hypothetical protein